jgi:hypothetical protein
MLASLTAGVPASFKVTDQSADPALNVPSNAVAVLGNLTAVNEAAGGYFSLTPAPPVGSPKTSALNFPRGDVRANAVTVPIGAGGLLWVTYGASAGKHADVLFDVTGYFVPDTSGATYVPLTPNRLVDSRGPTHLGLHAPLTTGAPVEFAVIGRSTDDALNVPTDAVGVTGNLTAVGATANGFLALTPDDPGDVLDTSTLNFPKADTRANAVTVPLGSDGGLWVTYGTTAVARVEVLFDVSGYFTMN